MVTQLFRLVCQVIGIYSDTMTANKTWPKVQKIPLASSSF